MSDNLKERYDDLKWAYEKRGDKISELQRELNKYSDLYYHAQHRVDSELEPRIKQEQRSYDAYVTYGGGDECMQNGMWGHCGIECSVFGSKYECFENMTKEDILNLYREGYDFEYILQYIEDMELTEEKKKIDIECYEEQIRVKQEELQKLKNELNKIKEIKILREYRNQVKSNEADIDCIDEKSKYIDMEEVMSIIDEIESVVNEIRDKLAPHRSFSEIDDVYKIVEQLSDKLY